ncbi:MAG: hypothetical protein H5T50_00210 [Nitrososphaeria archaeon]|nr:hypothetical protein [Nitrososphaeria archaeon]
MKDDLVESKLKGNTLRVYIYVLKRRRVGVREVQRSLRLSNPSLALYHLNKLKELGLVREENGEYEVVDEVKVDVMRDFLRFGTLLVPRFVMYAVFFTFFTVYLAIVSFQFYSSTAIVYWFIALLTLSTAIFWYESISAWYSAPS